MSKWTSDIGLATLLLSTGLVLSACGGGGGSGGSSSSSSASSVEDGTLKAGLYTATIEYVDGKPTQRPTAYLSPTGRFAIVFNGSTGVSVGELTFTNASISGTSNDYRQVDSEGFVDDKGDEGTISGTVSSQESATFSTSDSSGEVNTNVTLQRQNGASDVGISLERASGSYTLDTSSVVLTVEQDGSVFAQYPQATGCVLETSKAITVPDASINTFNITYTMSNCADPLRNGEYSGTGFFGGQEIAFTAHNGEVAMKFIGSK